MPVADFAQGVKSPFFSMVNHTNDGARAKLASTATATNIAQTNAANQTSASSDEGSFLDHVLDVVNPLQHLPVVGTLYRAITGDKIGDVEKVAGDTLYGGPIGLVSSLADLAFEKITGKDVGDTMLAMVGMGGSDTALAANTAKPEAAQAERIKTAELNKASLMPAPASKIAQAVTAPIQIVPTATKPPAALASATPATATLASTTPQTVIDISPQTDALLASLQKNGVTGAMQAQAMDAYRRTMTMNTQSAAAH